MIAGYIIMCFIFGTTFLTIKIGLEEGMPPFWFAALRFFIAGAVILAFLGIRKNLPRLSFREYAEIACVGFLMTTIPFSVLFWAEQHIESGLAALLVATAPIFTTIIDISTRQTRFQWYLLIGLFFGFVGTSVIVGLGEGLPNDGDFSLVSKLSLVAGEFFYAVGASRSKKLMTSVPPFAFNGLQSVFSSVGLFALSFVFEEAETVNYSVTSVAALLYLSIVASVLASGIFYWLLKETNSTFPSTWTYVAPVIAMIVGAVFLSEKISALNVVGGVFVLAGIVILNWKTWEQILNKKKTELREKVGG